MPMGNPQLGRHKISSKRKKKYKILISSVYMRNRPEKWGIINMKMDLLNVNCKNIWIPFVSLWYLLDQEYCEVVSVHKITVASIAYISDDR